MPHFSKFVGSDEMKNRIGDTVLCGRLSHAYVIEGRAGSGKRTFALQLAAAACCERRHERPASLPCCECASCRKILEKKTPDLHIVDRGDRASVSVETIRDMRSEMMLSATELDSSVYIICDADCMTAGAQNALLIALEEPPKNVLILLLAESCESLLPTIRSRVQLLRMGYVGREQMREHLLQNVPGARSLAASAPDKLDAVLCAADGRIGEAIRFLSPKTQNELLRRRQAVFDLVRAFALAHTYASVYAAVTALPAKRAELAEIFPMILDAVRDLCAVRRAQDAPLLFFSDREEALAIAERADYARLFHTETALRRAKEDIAANANVSMTLTALATSVFYRS